jgi:hypothetical protein
MINFVNVNMAEETGSSHSSMARMLAVSQQNYPTLLALASMGYSIQIEMILIYVASPVVAKAMNTMM